jgi:glutamate 5-kinase
MASKLRAARMVTSAGEAVIIASGRDPQVLTKILAGEPIGTLFQPHGKAISPRKRWIGFSVQKPRGRITLDPGACRAIVDQKRSLLAIGITAVEGTFGKGDVVSVSAPDGLELARGLTNYGSEELAKIKGVKSDRIPSILGHRPYEEVIHCDNLVILHSSGGEIRDSKAEVPDKS